MSLYGCLEWQYIDDLTKSIVDKLDLKPKPALVCIGNRCPDLFASIVQKTEAKAAVYADTDEEALAKGETEEVLTTCCDVKMPPQVAALGKYDGVIVKAVIEHIALDLPGFLSALWKIMKLNTKAIIIVRKTPGFPATENILETWKSASVIIESLCTAAEEEGFSVELHQKRYDASINKQDLGKLLMSLPGAVDEDVEKFVEAQENTTTFEDKLTFIVLAKEIT